MRRHALARAGSSLVLTRLRAEPDTLRAIDAQTLQSVRGRGITLRFTGPSTFTLDNGRAGGLEFRRVDE